MLIITGRPSKHIGLSALGSRFGGRAITARRALVAALTAMLLAALPAQAAALTINQCSFPANLTTWSFNGNAFEAQNAMIRLTTVTPNEASSAFLLAPIPVTSALVFHAYFRFQMASSSSGGDGIAFVMHNSPAGAAALGGTAGNLGYAGSNRIASSVIIEFDTYRNAPDTNANHVGLMLNGSTTHTAQAVPAFTMAGGGVLSAWVDYDASSGALAVYLSQTPTKPTTALLNRTLNLSAVLGSSMYVGFTSATGQVTGTTSEINQHDVYELALSTDGIPCGCEGDSACPAATPACTTSGVCAACSATNMNACSGLTPVCDVASSRCLGCLSHANCAAATPVCDATSRSCRACAGVADCGGSTPACVTSGPNTGACATCAADSDCPANAPRCNPTTNTCQGCLSAADCGGNSPVCSAGRCRACATDTDCGGATPACEVWGACGQCSATLATACGGAWSVCDYPTGTCVGCEFNTDCAGDNPTCDAPTHTCRACVSRDDCRGNPSASVCVTSGMKAGACVSCTADSDCSNPATPRCDTLSNTCVSCLVHDDCRAASPVCNAAHLCVGCASSADCAAAAPICDTASSTCLPCQNDHATSNPGPRPCATAELPACQPTGAPLAGQCGQCSSINRALCATQAATPVCVTTAATCGCTEDTDCSAGRYCDTSTVATGICTAGCRMLGGAARCAAGEYCSKSDGSIGVCMSEPCNGNRDCQASAPLCNTLQQPHACVQCINDGDCGSPTSGRVCAAGGTCVDGCRGGSGCPLGMECRSSDGPGTCAPAPADAGADAMAARDAATAASVSDAAERDGGATDMTAAEAGHEVAANEVLTRDATPDDGTPGDTPAGGSDGCSCGVAATRHRHVPGALATLALGLGLITRRRRKRAARR